METPTSSCKCYELVCRLEHELQTPSSSCKCLDLVYSLENELQTPRSSCKCLDLVYCLEASRPSVHLTKMIVNLLTQVRCQQTKCTWSQTLSTCLYLVLNHVNSYQNVLQLSDCLYLVLNHVNSS